jgi:hypothetical protein
MIEKIMRQSKNIWGLAVAALAILWALTGPNWFARGALGRAMTDLDIWAQIHLPYPVLTLLLIGFGLTCGALWLKRHMGGEAEEPRGFTNHRQATSHRH